METTAVQSKSKIERIAQVGLDFIENQWEFARLSLAENAAKGTSKLLSIVIVAVFSFFMLIFLSIGTAIWVGRAMGSTAIGFFIVALIYFILMVICLLFIKPAIENKISATIINALDNENED